jgi:DNA repair ATPase RecN
MPRVHKVQKARKDNPAAKAGEPYYWWKFRYGGKRYSKSYPKASQLTQSEYFGTVYCVEESFADFTGAKEDLESLLSDAESELETLVDELEEKQGNLEEAFPNGCPSLELITERHEAAQETLESVQAATEALESLDEDEDEEAALDGIISDIEWNWG